MNRLPRHLLLTTAILLGHIVASAQERVLFDFDAGFDFASVPTQDARVAETKRAAGSALRVTTGHTQRWPGITLKAPEARWDLTPFAEVTLAVKNAGTASVTVFCRVDNDGANGTDHCVTGSVNVAPGQTRTLRVPLKRAAGDTLGGKLFGMRGYPLAPGGPGTVDPSRITQVLVFLHEPRESHTIEVDDLHAAGAYTRPTAWVTDADPFFPFIDTFGQYRHRDWPGKVKSIADLRARRQTEAKELAANPGPANWSLYGGWADGPQLEATGFFRAAQHDGRWWLVDPEGRLFFSHGLDCVRMMDLTPVEGRETWWEDFPGAQDEFAEFFSSGTALHGHYAGKTMRCFAFAAANLKRKYGEDWRGTYARLAHDRLRSWGLNTIANWSDGGVFLLRRTPYTDNVSSRGAKLVEGSEGYWGKFPDVFDPSFAEALRRSMAGKRNTSANDPWCIGYFADNELGWGDEISLAIGALRSPAGQAAKQVFLADLEARYGDIARLNETWGTSHASWDAVRESRESPDPAKARADLTAFYTKTAETYFRTVRDTIKAVAPNQLYLGCRFAWANDRAARAAGVFCDVVSYNLYQRSIADFAYPGGDRPLIIGEFHFGALDRGMFHTGLVPVENQAERAAAYRGYVLGAVRHPQIVGTHWFQWQDQPTTGRFLDEENYQIGFLDIADTPYPEMIEASRAVAREMYRGR